MHLHTQVLASSTWTTHLPVEPQLPLDMLHRVYSIFLWLYSIKSLISGFCLFVFAINPNENISNPASHSVKYHICSSLVMKGCGIESSTDKEHLPICQWKWAPLLNYQWEMCRCAAFIRKWDLIFGNKQCVQFHMFFWWLWHRSVGGQKTYFFFLSLSPGCILAELLDQAVWLVWIPLPR